MSVQISRFLSQKFRFYTFTCIALLLFVHGYNLKETYLQPFTTVKEPLTFTTFFEYFMANGLLRFRIPLLFLISGYIYALKDTISYGRQLGRRARTLLVPYLIWSAVGLLITYLWQQHPVTAKAVLDAKIDQLGDNRPYAAIGWPGVLFRWVAAPIAFQVWFILALFLYNMLYPFIKWVVMRYTAWWLAFAFLLWAFELSFLVVDGRGLLFFSIGVWFQKMNFAIERKPQWVSLFPAWLIFIGFSVIKTFMAFELEPSSKATYWILNLMHDVSVLAGIIAVWYGGDRLVKWSMRQPWFVWASSFSFFIFGLHAPLVSYLTQLFYRFFGEMPNYRLFTYCTVPVLVLLFCMATAAVVRKLLPTFYTISTGGRGF
ncbi:MAG: acyltransferase [Sediminibacterium sp.]|nr:acyltransferase [Sediminibacterium sp.]